MVSSVDGTSLNNFIGTGTAAGATILDGIAPDELVATIRVSFVPVPEPTTAVFAGVGALALLRRHR